MGNGSGRMLVHVTNGIWRPLVAFGTPQQRALVRKLAAGELVVAFALTEQVAGRAAT